jgi:hypothetical protein
VQLNSFHQHITKPCPSRASYLCTTASRQNQCEASASHQPAMLSYSKLQSLPSVSFQAPIEVMITSHSSCVTPSKLSRLLRFCHSYINHSCPSSIKALQYLIICQVIKTYLAATEGQRPKSPVCPSIMVPHPRMYATIKRNVDKASINQQLAGLLLVSTIKQKGASQLHCECHFSAGPVSFT